MFGTGIGLGDELVFEQISVLVALSALRRLIHR